MPAFARSRALLLSIVLGASPSGAQGTPQVLPPDSTVLSILRSRVDAKLGAGYVVALVDSSGAARYVAAGAGAAGAPLDERSVFEIGSVTQTFTGVALASALRWPASTTGSAAVRLEQPVAELLPMGSIVPSRNGREITLRDLATHTSLLRPLPSDLSPRTAANPYAEYDSTRLLAFLSTDTLWRDPGYLYWPSKLGMGLLGYALARHAGVSYEQLIAREITGPLGMRETVITLTAALRARVAPGHDATGSPAPLWDLQVLAGAGGLRSTASDMVRYLVANMVADRNPTDARAHGLGEALRTSHQVHHTHPLSTLRLGLGWQRTSLWTSGDTLVWHNGMTGGYASFVGYLPRQQLGVVILSNSAVSVDDIAKHLLASRPLNPPTGPAALLASQVTALTGDYLLAPQFVITIRQTESGLELQATGQPAFPLFAASPTRFFIRAVDAQVAFELDDSGRATALTLLQNGLRQRAVRR